MMRLLLAVSVFLGTSPALIRANDPAAKQPDAETSWLLSPPRCTQRQCEQIRRGMSVEDVAAMLGCPPGDYTGGKGIYVAFIDPFPVDAVRRQHAKYWCGRDGAIGLVLDKGGKVRRADWYPALDPADAP
jgi:hypothetical protein